MTNPAWLLIEIFDSWGYDANKQIFLARSLGQGSERGAAFETQRRAMRHLTHLADLIHEMKRHGERVDHLESGLERWTMWVLAYPHDWEQKPKAGHRQLHDPLVFDLLRQFARELDRTLPRYDEQSRDIHAQTISEAEAALVKDESLPQALRLHLRNVLTHTRAVLEDYEILGDFDLQIALERLRAATDIAQSMSKDPGTWTRIKEKLVWPVTAGLMIGAPGNILQIAQQVSNQG